MANSEESQYLDLVRAVIERGERRANERTGVGTRSTFGACMRFSLANGSFPLLTTKRVFWRGVVEELKWFLKGETDSRILSEKGVKIWDLNTTRSELDSRGFFNYPEGVCGPVYGFQWRSWNSKYDPTEPRASAGCGIDQLARLVEGLRNDPESRRHILSAWNPEQIDEMVLPPCHVLCQFYASSPDPATGRRSLSCQLYQRSADLGLGVPFNIASYALLLCFVASWCDMDRGDYIHVIGDAHVYENHVEALSEQLSRDPVPFPTLGLVHSGLDFEDGAASAIDAFADTVELSLDGYTPHPPHSMKMAV
jgi:thymidylate synthase